MQLRQPTPCTHSTSSIIAIGIFRHCVVRTADGESTVVMYIYYFFGLCWLGMWGLGLHWRFSESGRAVCNETIPCAPEPVADDAGADPALIPEEPCVPSTATDAELELLQTQSCNFMKYYLDLAGLLIGGYAAWGVLAMTGANKTPVWTNKEKENNDQDWDIFEACRSSKKKDNN